jgi:hypothetical protein
MIRQQRNEFPTSEGKVLHKKRENQTSEMRQVKKQRTGPDRFAGKCIRHLV